MKRQVETILIAVIISILVHNVVPILSDENTAPLEEISIEKAFEHFSPLLDEVHQQSLIENSDVSTLSSHLENMVMKNGITSPYGTDYVVKVEGACAAIYLEARTPEQASKIYLKLIEHNKDLTIDVKGVLVQANYEFQ